MATCRALAVAVIVSRRTLRCMTWEESGGRMMTTTTMMIREDGGGRRRNGMECETLEA